MRTATITIDLQALNHNIEQVAKLSSHTTVNLQSQEKKATNIMVMLKANAYGHGLDVCTLALLQNHNVHAIGVATMEEALQVKILGWEKTIVLIEGVFSEQEWQTAIRYEIQCVIHHQRQLDWALQTIPSHDSPTCTLWLKYNTGMNRLGFSTEQISPIATQLDNAGYQQVLISHFANSDDRTHPLNAKQGKLFSEKLTELRKIIPTIKGSLCNSAGIVNFPEWHYDWVRAGIMIYGASPLLNNNELDKSAKELNLQAVMTLSTKIMAIHQVQAGDMVGYGSRWMAEGPTHIGIISIGYGDGYPRVVDDMAFVGVIGNIGNTDKMNNINDLSHLNDIETTQTTTTICPIIGRVAMDMLVIDLSPIVNKNNINTNVSDEVNIGVSVNDRVILWGNPNQIKNCPHIDQIAKSANTINYELLCRLTTRPKRKLV